MADLQALLAQRQAALNPALRTGNANTIADIRGKILSLQRQIAMAGARPAAPVAPSGGGGAAPPTGAAPLAPSDLDAAFQSLLAQFTPRSQSDIDALTQQRVNLAITPQRLAIERAQQQADLASRGAQASVQGFTQALAPALSQIGPRTQQAYTQAAQTQGGLSAGFSAGMQAALNSSTQQSNQALQNLGSPQQIGDQSQNAADVLYGLGGYIPASTLNREGAAFAAAQNQLPATAIGLGQEQVGKLAHEGVVQQAGFSRDLNELMQQVPSRQADIRGGLEDQNFQRAGAGFDALMSLTQFQEGQRQFDVGQGFAEQQFQEQVRQADRQYQLEVRTLGVEKAQANRDYRIQVAQAEANIAYIKAQTRQIGAGITGYDPVTGQPTFENTSTTSAARAAAVAARDDAVVSAIESATKTVEASLTPGTVQKQIGAEPVGAPSIKVGKNTIPQWYLKNGGVTDNPNAPNILTRPIYAQQELPKPEFNSLLNKVESQLRLQLNRYGVKPERIRVIALDILDDYFVRANLSAGSGASSVPTNPTAGAAGAAAGVR